MSKLFDFLKKKTFELWSDDPFTVPSFSKTQYHAHVVHERHMRFVQIPTDLKKNPYYLIKWDRTFCAPRSLGDGVVIARPLQWRRTLMADVGQSHTDAIGISSCAACRSVSSSKWRSPSRTVSLRWPGRAAVAWPACRLHRRRLTTSRNRRKRRSDTLSARCCWRRHQPTGSASRPVLWSSTNLSISEIGKRNVQVLQLFYHSDFFYLFK